MLGYRSLFRVPGVSRLVVSALVGRLPVAIISLALVLFVHSRGGGFAIAGVTAAAYGVGQGCVCPVLGRLIDRRGLTRVLTVGAVINAGALLGVVVTGFIGLRLAGVALAGISGAARPPLTASLRRLLSEILSPGAALDCAYALESVVAEVISISGSLLTAGLALAGSPAAALVCASTLSFAGTLWFARSPHARNWRGEREARQPGPLRSGGVRTLVTAALLVGIAFGALEVGLPAFAAHHGIAGAAGIGFAAMSVASLSSGLWYGVHRFHGSLGARYVALAALFAAALSLPPFAPSVAVMVLLMGLAGVFVAPLWTCLYALVDNLTPRATLTEAFTWLTAANVGGIAAGNALAGVTTQQLGFRLGLGLAAIFSAAAVLISVMGWRTIARDGRAA